MDKEKRQQIIIKICCVLASFGLWLYISNVENPITTYTLKDVPVELKNGENLSKYRLTLIDDEEYYVDLSLKGVKSDVYNVKPSDIKVIADLSAYSLKNGENRIPVEVRQTPRNVSVLNTANLWVKVSLDELVEKNVPIKVYIKGEAKEGYYVHESIIKPTDVLVYGASKYVNAVSKAIAEVDISDVDSNVSVTLALRAVDSLKRTIENVKLEPGFVDVVIPINKIKSVDVKVITEGQLSDNYSLKSIKPSIEKVSVVGEKDKLEDLRYIETKPINLETITGNTVRNAELSLPQGVEIINLEENFKVNINVEKIIQTNLILNIKYKNLNENYKATFDNKNVSLILEGTESVINELNYGDITCEVNLMSLTEGEHIVPVNVSVPNSVRIVSEIPDAVNVTIDKKEILEEEETESTTGLSKKQTEENDVNKSE